MSNASSNIGDAQLKQPNPQPDRVAGRGWKWMLLILPLGYLWFRLISNLWAGWYTDPEYSYGLVVPLLVAGLLLRRWYSRPSWVLSDTDRRAGWFGWLALGMAFLYLPTRLIEAATPEWRPIQWVMAFEVVGITLYAIYLVGGKSGLRWFAFPVVFFLVSVPWPTPIEQPIIQGLSRMNAALVVNVMGILNIPAVQHGNTIEVSSGVVGINDACSGIRSLQSSLMISLFMGEFYLFSWQRRLLLVPISFALAMFLNLVRASLLTWIAGTQGVKAISIYHDEAGLTILFICTGLLWVAALVMRGRKSASAARTVEPVKQTSLQDNALKPGVARRWQRYGLRLLVWVVLVEVGVQSWYGIRDATLPSVPDWTVSMPTNNPTYKKIPFTQDEHILLKFDNGKKGQWQEGNGTFWQAYYFNWKPGRVAGYLAKRHTPDICLTATGLKMISDAKLMVLHINGVELPFRHYIFGGSDGRLQVYQCRWDAGEQRGDYTADESSRFNLIRGVWAGRGDRGQKVLEIIIQGCHNATEARKELIQHLRKMIKVEKTATGGTKGMARQQSTDKTR